MNIVTSTSRCRGGQRDVAPPGVPSDARHRDAGFSLTEVVVTIALVGIVVIPIMSSVFAAVRVSAVSRSAAQVETAVVNASDRVNRAPRSCDYTSYAQAAVQTQGWEPTTATVVHQHLQRPTSASAPAIWVANACDSAGNLPEVQLVTISITSPDGRVTRSIQVVKSDV